MKQTNNTKKHRVSDKKGKPRMHIIHPGNRQVILATREAIGAMKYKSQ